MPSNIIRTPTLDFCHSVKICRPTYNTHPLISTQEVWPPECWVIRGCIVRSSSFLADAHVIVSCCQEVVDLVAASSQHCGSNERVVATSLEPNRIGIWPWMTALPCRQSPCGIQFTRVPCPSITAVAAGRGSEERRADSASQMLQHELKGPSHLGPFIHL